MSEEIKQVASDDGRQKCEVWTRVMGYYRPTSEFNTGKKSEAAQRVCFDEPDVVDG